MKHHQRTPPVWRAWLELLLEGKATRRLLAARELDIDLLRQVASAEAALARYGIVRQSSSVLADLILLPVDDVVRARLALVHLGVVVMARAEGGELVRQLTLPQSIQRVKTLPPEVLLALERIQIDTSADAADAFDPEE